jgi:hypothetical protein
MDVRRQIGARIALRPDGLDLAAAFAIGGQIPEEAGVARVAGLGGNMRVRVPASGAGLIHIDGTGHRPDTFIAQVWVAAARIRVG